MTLNNDTPQSLRLPNNMIREVDKISKQLSISKNDVYKMAIGLLINKLGGNLEE